MIICEASLLTTLLALLINTSYTDCKESIVRNRTLAKCGLVAIVLDSVYYIGFAYEYLLFWVANLLLMTIVALAFYGYHLWAAGDSKLLFVVGLCIPGRFYSFWDIGIWSGFAIIVFTFSIAFIYVVLESIVLGIKNKNLFKITLSRPNFAEGIVSYFSMVGAILLINLLLSLLLKEIYNDDTVFATAINFMVVLTLIHFRAKISFRALCYCTIAIWVVIIALVIASIVTISTTFDIRSWLLVLAIMAVRMVAEKYNYKTIPTRDVRKGQILSTATVMSFKPSRVQGLPAGMTEDLRSRITEEEANSIRRWESSALGQEYIVIVRKIPFATFIGIGTILFLIIEVTMIWL
jgi:preflagellin peptidase FlaK